MFVRIGISVGWIGLVLGSLQLARGVYIAWISDPEARAAATFRYIGSGTSGESIDQAIIMIVVSLIVGLLARIADR